MEFSRGLKIAAVVIGIIVLYVLVVLGIKMMRGGDTTTPVVTTAKIEFWNVFDTSAEVRPLLDKFTAQYGITVNYRSFPDTESYREALLAELASGGGPDVFVLHRSWVDKYRKLVAPLPATQLGVSTTKLRSNFVDVVGKDFFLSPLPDPKTKKQPDPSAVEVLGLPMYVDTLGLFYNDSIFKKVLGKPSGRPEATWEGVREDTAKITLKDATDSENIQLAGIALGTGSNIIRAPDIFAALLLESGISTIVQNSTVHFGAEGATVLDFLTRFSRNPLYAEYTWNNKISADTQEKEVDAFARGEVAMITGYSYYFERIKSRIAQLQRGLTRTTSASDVRAVPLPQFIDPTEGNPKVALADYFALTVAKNSKIKQDSWNLVLFLTSKDVESQYVAATRKPASRPDILEKQVEDSELAPFAEQAVYAEGLNVGDTDKFAIAVRAMLDAVSAGKLDIPHAINAGESYLTCLLAGSADELGCTFSE